MQRSDPSTPEERARRRAKDFTDLMWHAAVFVVVNGFLWLQDILISGGGLNYAYWVTIFWGIGLVFHAVYVFGERTMGERKYRQYLEEERRQESRSR